MEVRCENVNITFKSDQIIYLYMMSGINMKKTNFFQKLIHI